MKKYSLFQVDSFTKEKFRGNPAGVVLNADGLTDAQMQNIAREMNLSETAFILSPTASDHDIWLRYFTPMCEVPICGHATIAAHYVRALYNKIQTPVKILSKTGVGILPVDVVIQDKDYKIIMTQGKIEYGCFIKGEDKATLLCALGLTNEDIDQSCPIQIVSTGHSKVMIGIKSIDKLNSIVPDNSTLIKLSKSIGCNGYFVFTFDTRSNDHLTSGRMFAPSIGLLEDPVTGNAHGPLGAYLIKHKLAETSHREDDIDIFKFYGKQGEAIGRTGVVEVTVSVKDGEPCTIQIGGNAVIVFQAELNL